MVRSGGRGEGSGRGGYREGGDYPEHIDRYVVKRLLGTGGQGSVYLAFDPNLEIDVAVKVLHPEYRSEEFLERLKTEARTAVRLVHPNVVRVYDFKPEHPYLVMEYCGDGDLNRYIKRREQHSLREILSLVRQICEALAVAHEHAPPILHRDLKPANVLFQKSIPKVGDFGLAKVMGGSSGVTTTRGWMGTVRYCSPEQLRDASRVDHRADLWSVAVILYEMLTWVRPFDRPDDSFVNVAVRVHTEPPMDPPYALPEPVLAFLLKSLQKNPSQRFGSAREVVEGIDQLLREVPDADRLLLPPEHLMDDLSRTAADVAQLLDQERSEEASTLIQRMKRASPDSSLSRYWDHRLREVRQESAVSGSGVDVDTGARQKAVRLQRQFASIQSLITARNYRDARRKIYEILQEDPDNTIAARWLDSANDEERQLKAELDRAHQEADAARAQGAPRKVRDVWQALTEKYQDLDEALAELAIATRELQVLEQREARDAASREASRCAMSGDLRAAVAVWRRFLSAYPQDPEATQEMQTLLVEMELRERAERLARLKADALQRRASGDLTGALGAWETYLKEDSASGEARRAVQTLRSEIDALERARRFEEARSEAETLRRSEDFSGAIRVWEQFLQRYPTDGTALDQVKGVQREQAEHSRRALREEVHHMAAGVQSRIEGRRYRSLPEVQEALARAVDSARAALEKDSEILAAFREQLVAAQREAEATVSAEIASRRSAVLERLEEGRELVAGTQGDTEERDAPSEERLGSALRRALQALCEPCAADAPLDPLQALSEAESGVADAAAALIGERERAVSEARAEAVMSLSEAQRALGSLVTAVPQDAMDGGSDSSALAARLRRLGEETSSPLIERLRSVRLDADVLKAEADAARRVGLARLKREVETLADEAASLAVRVPSDRLEQLLQRAASSLEPAEGDASLATGALAEARDELRAELASTRRAQEKSFTQARDRWQTLLRAWQGMQPLPPSSTCARAGEEIVVAGAAALSGSRAPDLESLAVQLAGFLKRARLEVAWSGHSEAVAEIEGPLGQDGALLSDPESADEELLKRYRAAVAAGDEEEIRSLGPGLEKRRSALTSREGGAARGRKVRIPALSRRERRLNERYNPVVLAYFDEIGGRCRQSLAETRRTEAERLEPELARAHRRLLRPIPLWRLAVPPAAVGALIVAATVLLWPRPEEIAVAVIGPGGEVRVREVTRNGRPVTGLDLRVPEEGTTWPLAAGDYELETESGAAMHFQVPRDTVVLLPGGEDEYDDTLLRWMDLSDLGGSSR